MAKYTLSEESADPTTPSAGNWRLYFKAGGLYIQDDAGTVIGPISTTPSLNDNSVALAKLINATAQYNLIGRSTASAGAWEQKATSANTFALLGAADYAAMRALLDLEGGTDFPSYATGTTASSATPTPAGSATRTKYTVTALAEAATFGEPSGSPIDGNMLLIRIKDNGTARALAYNAIYRAVGVTLPTTTVLSKTLYLLFIYNSADTKWDCISVGQEG